MAVAAAWPLLAAAQPRVRVIATGGTIANHAGGRLSGPALVDSAPCRCLDCARRGRDLLERQQHRPDPRRLGAPVQTRQRRDRRRRCRRRRRHWRVRYARGTRLVAGPHRRRRSRRRGDRRHPAAVGRTCRRPAQPGRCGARRRGPGRPPARGAGGDGRAGVARARRRQALPHRARRVRLHRRRADWPHQRRARDDDCADGDRRRASRCSTSSARHNCRAWTCSSPISRRQATWWTPPRAPAREAS